MSVTATILGCGSSMGVPRVAMGWGACNPNNPKNRRRRCSLLVEKTGAGGVTRILIDCSPDLREQLVDAKVDRLDAVLLTHEHADHTHGIDDLRPLFVHNRRRTDIYMDEPTSRALHARFSYCFTTPPGSDYPPIVTEHRLAPGEAVTINGPGGALRVLPIRFHHGDIDSLGFRIGDFCYAPDLKAVPAESEQALTGLATWVVDALRYAPHSSHVNVEETLALIARFKPKRAILTDLHCDLDFDELGGRLAKGIEPAYDHMIIGIF